MNIKYFIGLVLLIVAVTTYEVGATFGYEKTTPSNEPTATSCCCSPTPSQRTTTPKPTTKPTPSWKAGVDEHVAKCKAALKFYIGELYKPAKTLLAAFLCLIPKLEQSTTNESPIISSYSVEILKLISLLTEVGGSPSGILNGFEKTLDFLLNNYADIFIRLGVNIGISTSDVANAVIDLNDAIHQIIDKWHKAAPLHIGADKINYEPVLSSIQKLMDAVSFVSDEYINNCEDNANATDSLYVSAFLLHHVVIIGLATNVSIAADLNIRCSGISHKLSQCLKVVDNLLCGLTNALNAVVNVVPETVISIGKTIDDLAESLNDVLETVFGLVGNVKIIGNFQITDVINLKGVAGGIGK